MAKLNPQSPDDAIIATVPAMDLTGVGAREVQIEEEAEQSNMKNTDKATSEADPAVRKRSPLRQFLIMVALFMSLFVAALDITIVATAVPTIAAQLHSASGYTWIGAAYLLGAAASGPIWSRLSDVWGRKAILLLAVSVFSAASIVCALSINMKMLIAGRALQGMAGGGLILLVNITISDLYSVRNRSLYLGLLEGVWAFAAGIGPVLGGALTQYATWRWNFWINLPMQGTTFILLLFFLDVHNPRTKMKDGIKAIDWFGSISILGLVLMLLLGLDFGGETYAWNSPTVICLIVFGALMSLFFIYSERHLAKYPLIPLELFKNRSNVASLSVCMVHSIVFLGAEYYMPLYFQAVHSTSPTTSGILILPLIVPPAIIGILVGIFIHRTGRYLECMYLGTLLMTIANGLFILFSATTPIATIIGFEIIEGLGVGLLFEPPLIAIQSLVSQDDTAAATSTLSFVRNIGTSLSVVLGGVVFQNGMALRLPFLQSAGLSPELAQQFSGKDAAANVMRIREIKDSAKQFAVKEAFAWSMRNMWIMYCCVGFLGFVASFWIQKVHLSQDHTETITGLKKEKFEQPPPLPSATEESGMEMT